MKKNLKEKVVILGLSCFYHDAAAALLIDGKVVAAAQEERFTRKKHDEDFPENAIKYCLESNDLSVSDIDYVVFYDKPVAKFERLLQTFIKTWPLGLPLFISALRVWLKDKLWIEHLIAKKLKYDKDILFTEHHYSHAASAYYASEFDDAIVVTMDGVGEWDTASIGYGAGKKLVLTDSIKFPHSIGLLYSAITYYLGFKVNSAEYKVMGLAPYGDPSKYSDQFKELIEVADDGSFKLNMDYFAYEYGKTMTNAKLNKLFGGPPRSPEAKLEQHHKDIAAALQKITEEIVLKIVKHAHSKYPSKNLCLSGGVALNCVANGKINDLDLFDDIYIQPASGDAGGAVGAACYLYYAVLGNEKVGSAMDNIYLGPAFSDEDINQFLDSKSDEIGRKVRHTYLSQKELPKEVAKLIADDQVVGWFQGRMEFGPRALGNRSILADARNKNNWQRVNRKIKYRESFRPFAPSVLEEKAEKYFRLNGSLSPYMLLVANVIPNTIPAVTHVDSSARIQTVNRSQNEKYYDLISAFDKITGTGVIINTSFNVRGEPIVCTPSDAFHCFVNTEMDYLILGNYLISKNDNQFLMTLTKKEDYLSEFELD